jgi:hypothetical protein
LSRSPNSPYQAAFANFVTSVDEGQAVDLRAADIFCAPAVHHETQNRGIVAVIVFAREAGGALAAGDDRGEHDLLTYMHGTHSGANLGHFPGDIAAGDMRERNLIAGHTAPDPQIEVVEGARAHVNEDFIVSEMRFVYVGVMQNAGVTVLMEKNGFHDRPPRKRIHTHSRQTYRCTICWRYLLGLS